MDYADLSNRLADVEVGHNWRLIDMLAATLIIANGVSPRQAKSRAKDILNIACERVLSDMNADG